MTVNASDLVGAWRLERWSLVYDDGRPDEHPLGEDAHGLILYTADGHVSATLMRAARPAAAPHDAAGKVAAYDECFAYAGRYEVRDGAVHHSIAIATNPSLIGKTTMRHIALSADRLVLSGPDFAAGTARSQRITWRRA